MPLPSNVQFGTVVGQFLAPIIDGSDVDGDPDVVAMSGTITFTASVTYIKNMGATPNPVTYIKTAITGILDSEGYLCTPNPLGVPTRGLRLIATDDPDLNPTNWVYNVSYNLTHPQKSGAFSLPPHSISIPMGSVNDLTGIVPEQSVGAVVTTIGPAGKSAYDIAVKNGFIGSESEWLDSLVGPAGDGTGGTIIVSWDEVTDKPSTFTPSTHTHETSQITGLDTALNGKAPNTHTHTADDISDSTIIGKSVLKAADASAARTAIGAGTSNLVIGSTSTTAKAGDYTPSWAEIADKPTTFAPIIGSTSTTAVAGNDSRLSDPRIPLAHSHTISDVSGLQSALDSASGSGSSSSSVIVADEPSGGDDTASLNAQLASASGKTFALRAGRTYKIYDTLVYPIGIKEWDFNGATLDASGIPFATFLGERIAVTAIGSKNSSLPISSIITQGTRIITGISDTSSLAVGDLVLIRNEEAPVPGMTRTDRDKGELNIVRSVDSATQITLTIATQFSYGTTGLVIEKVDPVKNVKIKNGFIVMGGVGKGHCGIQVRYGKNVLIDNMFIDGAEDTAVNLRTVWNGKVVSGKMSNSTSSATIGTSGYGVCMVDGSRFCTTDGVEFFNNRHHVTGGGFWPTTNVRVKDCVGVQSINASYDTHESCFHWEFINNSSFAGGGGFGMRGQYVTVRNNYVEDCTGTAYEGKTFDGVSEQRSVRFIDNEAVRCFNGVNIDGIARTGEPDCLKIDCEVSGNILTDCGNATTDAVIIRHFDGLKVFGQNITRPGRNGMYILGLVGTQSKNLTMGDNEVSGGASNSIELAYIDNITYSGGVLLSPLKSGMQMTNCNKVSYSAPFIRNPGQHGINISNGSDHSIDNPNISGGLGASYDAIRTVGLTDLTVAGGSLGSARYAVYATTSDYVTITGVNMRGAANAARYSVDATNKAISNNIGVVNDPAASVAWASITGKPTTFAPTIGSTSTTAVAGNDSRLTNARTPTAHSHPISEVTGLQAALDSKASTSQIGSPVLVLNAGDPVPQGTVSGTVIVRRSA